MSFIKYGIAQKLALTLLFFAITPQAFAEGFSITPFVGFRASDSLEEEETGQTIDIDNSSSFGLILSMNIDDDSAYELYFSRQETDLLPRTTEVVSENLGIRIDYIHIGGTVDYTVNNLHPFVTGGLGATLISATDYDSSTETKFSLSVGGGLKVPITERVGLRFESRILGTNAGGGGGVLCSNGQCVGKLKGSVFLQFEASLGLSFAF